MCSVGLSSANYGYVNTIIADAQKNSQLQKQFNATKVEDSKPKKESSKSAVKKIDIGRTLLFTACITGLAVGSSNVCKVFQKISDQLSDLLKKNTDVTITNKMIEGLTDSIQRLQEEISMLSQDVKTNDISPIKKSMGDVLDIVKKLASSLSSTSDKVSKVDTDISKLEKLLKDVSSGIDNISSDLDSHDKKFQLSEFVNTLTSILSEMETHLQRNISENIDQGSQTEIKQISDIQMKLSELLSKMSKDNKIVKVKTEVPIDDIRFVDKIPYLKSTNKMYSGIITKTSKDGGRYEMLYQNGELVESSKFDTNGIQIFKKEYSKIKKLISGEPVLEQKVKTTRKEGLTTSFKQEIKRNRQTGAIEYRKFDLMSSDQDTGDYTQLMVGEKNPTGFRIFDNRKKARIVTQNAQGKRNIEEKPSGFEMTNNAVLGTDGKVHNIRFIVQ